MSYGWQVYAVDIQAVNTIFGEQQYQTWSQRLGAQLQRLTAEFDDSADEALAHIVSGKIDAAFDPSLYWYLYELLVQWQGQVLNNSEFYPAELRSLSQCSALRPFNRHHPWLPISTDFPVVYAGHQTELTKGLADIETADLSSRQKQQLLGWLEQAGGRDLLLFYY